MTPTQRQNAEVKGGGRVRTQPMFHQVLSARPDSVRGALMDVRRRFAGEVSDDTLGRLELVLAEVMNNVAEHAATEAGGTVRRTLPQIHLCIVRHESGLACAITDNGISVPADCLLPRDLPRNDVPDLPEGGFGWYLIQDLTQALCYYREQQRNFLAFSVPFAEV